MLHVVWYVLDVVHASCHCEIKHYAGVCCVIRLTHVVMQFAHLALSPSLIIQYLALKTRTSSSQFTTSQLAN